MRSLWRRFFAWLGVDDVFDAACDGSLRLWRRFTSAWDRLTHWCWL